MTIAVTAASGQLGASIVQSLLPIYPKENILALARTPHKASHLGVKVGKGDYNQPAELEKSLQGVDTLLLVSGMDAPEERIVQHRNVIQSAKNAGVKKIVYTSIQGAAKGTSFSPIVQSNRQTESDIQASGLSWVIGRNGLYIEPDIAYIDHYKKDGCITNCASEGLCGYTTRQELGYAYARMLTEQKHHQRIYNLHGTPISQATLAKYINSAFHTQLSYIPMSPEAYLKREQAELGDFLGRIVAGIYEGIALGKLNNPSHFEQAAGRKHLSWEAYFNSL